MSAFHFLLAHSRLPYLLLFFHVVILSVSVSAEDITDPIEKKQAVEIGFTESESAQSLPDGQKQHLDKLLKEAEAEQKSQQLEEKQEIIDEAVNDFIVKNEEGKEIVCSKENTIATEVDGQVRYRCRSESQILGEDKDSKRGEGETNQLINDLMQTSNQSDEKQISLDEDELKKLQQLKQQQQDDLDKAALERAEQKASEQETPTTPNETTSDDSIILDDPVIEEQNQEVILPFIPDKGLDGVDIKVKKQDTSDVNLDKPPTDATTVAVEIEDLKAQGFVEQTEGFLTSLPIKGYISFRSNLDFTQGEDFTVSDGGSRGGLIYAQRLDNDDQIILHAELGTDVFGGINAHLNDETTTGANNFNRRLSYMRFGREDYYFVVGKNWSVYHFVASMTDKFITVGGKATGIYNAASDGGATGSGRADNALQLRSSRGNVQWGMQVQMNNSIPHLNTPVDYLLNAGLAAKWKSLRGYSVGVAYNRAVPEIYTQEMLDKGLNSSSDVMVLGVDVELGDWFLASTISHSQSQVTDDTGQYYEANGWEFYSRYNFTPRYHGRYGFNWQEPYDDLYQGQHDIKELYLSFDYNYNRLNMQDRVYLEYVQNAGHNADGSDAKNVIVLGFHFNLSN